MPLILSIIPNPVSRSATVVKYGHIEAIIVTLFVFLRYRWEPVALNNSLFRSVSYRSYRLFSCPGISAFPDPGRQTGRQKIGGETAAAAGKNGLDKGLRERCITRS